MVDSSSTCLFYISVAKFLKDFIKVVMNLSKAIQAFIYVSNKHATLHILIHSFIHSTNTILISTKCQEVNIIVNKTQYCF